MHSFELLNVHCTVCEPCEAVESGKHSKTPVISRRRRDFFGDIWSLFAKKKPCFAGAGNKGGFYGDK